jgi:hypothetical protein
MALESWQEDNEKLDRYANALATPLQQIQSPRLRMKNDIEKQVQRRLLRASLASLSVHSRHEVILQFLPRNAIIGAIRPRSALSACPDAA